MNERQGVLTLVGEFLTKFYRQTWNYEDATKNARAHLGQYPHLRQVRTEQCVRLSAERLFLARRISETGTF